MRIKIAMALLAVVAGLTRRVALVNTEALGSAMFVTNIYCLLTMNPSDPFLKDSHTFKSHSSSAQLAFTA